MAFVPGLTVRILTRERARTGHRPVVDALLDVVRHHALAGITVTRGMEGYSGHGGMRTSSVVELGDDLPLVIEIVDRAERIEHVLPEISALITEGALTISDVRLWVADAV